MKLQPNFNDTTAETTMATFKNKGFSENCLYHFSMRGLKQTQHTPNVLLATGIGNRRTYFEMSTNIDPTQIEQLNGQEYVTFNFAEKYFEYHTSTSDNEALFVTFRYKSFTGGCYVSFTTSKTCYTCDIDINIRINE